MSRRDANLRALGVPAAPAASHFRLMQLTDCDPPIYTATVETNGVGQGVLLIGGVPLQSPSRTFVEVICRQAGLAPAPFGPPAIPGVTAG